MKHEESKRREYATKLGLIVLFSLGYLIFWQIEKGVSDGQRYSLQWFDFILLGLATFRLGRMIAYDLVSEPLRQAFTETVKDPTGVGDTVQPKGSGARLALGQLLSCPICTGTWVAGALVGALYVWPEGTRPFLAIFGAVGFAEVLNSLAEAFGWSGHLARVNAGRRKRTTLYLQRPSETPKRLEKYAHPIDTHHRQVG